MNENTIRRAIETGHSFGSYPEASQLETQIKYAINDTLKLRGQPNMDAVTEDRVVKIIAKTLYEDYPSLTDNELPIILQAGASGELSRETWISGALILQWIRVYSRHQMRIGIVDEKHEEKQSRQTKEEIDARNEMAYKDSFEKGYQSYVKNGTIFHKDGFALPQWPSIIYDEFRRRGVIPEPTEDERRYAERKASVYKAENRVKYFLSYESMKLRESDIYKSFLLEAYYTRKYTGK